MRIATFNLENLDDESDGDPTRPTLAERVALMRPQLLRGDADVLCLQEVHTQGASTTAPSGRSTRCWRAPRTPASSGP